MNNNINKTSRQGSVSGRGVKNNVNSFYTNDKSNNNNMEMIQMKKTTIETRYGTATLNKSGYYEIENENGKKQNLHKLIYLANNGEIPKGYEIHHKNGVKTDNDPRNLVALPKHHHKLLHQAYNNKGDVKMINKKLCKTIENLDEKINFARRELKELRENNERYTDELADRELTIAEQDKIIRERDKLIEEKEKEILVLEAEKIRVIRDNQEHIERNKELRMVLLNTQAQLREKEDEVVIKNYEIKNKEKECGNLKVELENKGKECGNLEKECGNLKVELENKGKECGNLKVELENKEKECGNLEKEFGNLRVDYENIQKELNDRNEELEYVEKELDKSDEELQKSKKRIENFGENLEKTKKELREAREELIESQEKTKLTIKENKRLRGELENDRKRMDTLDLMLDDIQDELDGIVNEESNLRVETEELVEDLENIEDSNFGFSETGFKCLPDDIKAQLINEARNAFEDSLISIRNRFDKLKGRQGELQALYNGICRRREKMINNGVLDFQ